MNTANRLEIQALQRVPYQPRIPLPSWKTMEETLRQWHEQSLSDREYLWLTPNFEDMADAVSKAMFSTSDSLDVPRFEGVRAEQDALTVRRSA